MPMPQSSAIIDRSRLPAQWLTALFAAEFWEQLGRTIATPGGQCVMALGRDATLDLR